MVMGMAMRKFRKLKSLFKDLIILGLFSSSNYKNETFSPYTQLYVVEAQKIGLYGPNLLTRISNWKTFRLNSRYKILLIRPFCHIKAGLLAYGYVAVGSKNWTTGDSFFNNFDILQTSSRSKGRQRAERKVIGEGNERFEFLLQLVKIFLNIA